MDVVRMAKPHDAILQIVTTKQRDGKYRIVAMGLNGAGQGVTLGADEGSEGEIVAITAALVKLLDAPR